MHDRHLARVECLIAEHYEVQAIRRVHPTLTCDVRGGFVRPDLGELWPVVFLSPVDVSVALCVEIGEEHMARIGTTVKGPQRIRHRHWEDWLGWESPLAGLHPQFFELPPPEQEGAVAAWFAGNLEWLAHAGLLLRKPGGA
jgi:hypothetical protein